MKKTTIQELYHIYLQHPNISKDTRTISEGCIYIALKGESFNGNSFADSALEKGAAYVLIDEEAHWKNEHYLLVDDVLKSLQQLANYHRKQISIPVIAISGSNGKTTTKELISATLSKKYNVLYTNGNYNNHIGVPLTLLRIRPEHEIAIVEMGANHQKEIDFLCTIAEPDYGMLTNIGKAHLEGFGGEEGVRIGKTEMFRFIEKNGGQLFINLDDPKIKASVPESVKTVTYSLTEDADCTGSITTTHPGLKGTWKTKHSSGQIESSLYGAYNFHNILAACCIANFFDVSPKQIDEAINQYESDMNRSQLVEKNGIRIYLDAYNANPSSMTLSLDNFEKSNDKEKIAILGDMFELGEASFNEHLKILQQLKNTNSIQRTILIGEHFSTHSNQFTNFLFFRTTSDAKQWFLEQDWSGKTLLLKGSRGMKLESLLED